MDATGGFTTTLEAVQVLLAKATKRSGHFCLVSSTKKRAELLMRSSLRKKKWAEGIQLEFLVGEGAFVISESLVRPGRRTAMTRFNSGVKENVVPHALILHRGFLNAEGPP
jgi:hypothetical protein